MTEWIDPFTCPICKSTDCVPVSGPENSKVLIIGDAPKPGSVEIFSSQYKTIIRQELAQVGIDFYQCKVAGFWKHPPNDVDACFETGLSEIMQASKTCTHILLIGADPVRYFTGMSVTEINGMPAQTYLFSGKVVYAMYGLGTIFNKSLGEIRLALSNFAKSLENTNNGR